MHLDGSLEYQFAATSSREMMRDLAMVDSSSLAKAMAASYHMRNLRGSVFT
jgi:hypothetical protein